MIGRFVSPRMDSLSEALIGAGPHDHYITRLRGLLGGLLQGSPRRRFSSRRCLRRRRRYQRSKTCRQMGFSPRRGLLAPGRFSGPIASGWVARSVAEDGIRGSPRSCWLPAPFAPVFFANDGVAGDCIFGAGAIEGSSPDARHMDWCDLGARTACGTLTWGTCRLAGS